LDQRGAELEGVLATPPGYGPWPLVVDLHGGPVNGLRAGRQPDLERWCVHGFAAFAPDYRGRGIAGAGAMVAAARVEEPRGGASEAGDVLSAVDALCGRASRTRRRSSCSATVTGPPW